MRFFTRKKDRKAQTGCEIETRAAAAYPNGSHVEARLKGEEKWVLVAVSPRGMALDVMKL